MEMGALGMRSSQFLQRQSYSKRQKMYILLDHGIEEKQELSPCKISFWATFLGSETAVQSIWRPEFRLKICLWSNLGFSEPVHLFRMMVMPAQINYPCILCWSSFVLCTLPLKYIE